MMNRLGRHGSKRKTMR